MAPRCGDYFVFCPVRCLIVVFSGSCLALWLYIFRDLGAGWFAFLWFVDMCTVCPVRCLIVVFSGSCLAIWLYIFRDLGAGWFAFLWFVDMCTVCLGLFTVSIGVIGRLCSVTEALSGHLLFYFSLILVSKRHWILHFGSSYCLRLPAYHCHVRIRYVTLRRLDT